MATPHQIFRMLFVHIIIEILYTILETVKLILRLLCRKENLARGALVTMGRCTGIIFPIMQKLRNLSTLSNMS